MTNSTDNLNRRGQRAQSGRRLGGGLWLLLLVLIGATLRLSGPSWAQEGAPAGLAVPLVATWTLEGTPPAVLDVPSEGFTLLFLRFQNTSSTTDEQAVEYLSVDVRRGDTPIEGEVAFLGRLGRPVWRPLVRLDAGESLTMTVLADNQALAEERGAPPSEDVSYTQTLLVGESAPAAKSSASTPLITGTSDAECDAPVARVSFILPSAAYGEVQTAEPTFDCRLAMTSDPSEVLCDTALTADSEYCYEHNVTSLVNETSDVRTYCVTASEVGASAIDLPCEPSVESDAGPSDDGGCDAVPSAPTRFRSSSAGWLAFFLLTALALRRWA